MEKVLIVIIILIIIIIIFEDVFSAKPNNSTPKTPKKEKDPFEPSSSFGKTNNNQATFSVPIQGIVFYYYAKISIII